MALFHNEITTLGLSELRSNPLENPAVPLGSPANWQWLTGGEPTAAGETVNENNALTISTVYVCVTFIAQAIASLPFEIWEYISGGREKAIDRDDYYLLATEPNPEMSAFTYKENQVGCLALTGNSYAQIERNSIGQPVAFWPLHPFKTKPVRRNNVLAYETYDGMKDGKPRILAPEDVLHVPLFSLDGIMGLSPIGLQRQALGLAKAQEKFGARFFGGGSRPGGVVMNKGPKPDPKTRQEISESWNVQHGGVNQGKTAFLWGGEWDYKQIGLSPEDSQFLGSRQYQRAEIAAMYHLPPHYAGDTSRLSGNNAEQQNLQVVIDTLRPYLARIENEYVRKLMPTQGRKANKYFISFDVSERLRGDFKTQQEGFAAGVQWGWFSPNDVRKKLGENPGPKELNVYRVPVNMQSAKTLLNTESIQDQPAGGDPNAAKGADDDTLPAEAPTPAERKLLGVYASAFSGLYSRSFRRLCGRDKRDSAAIHATVRPILRCISDLALEMNNAPAEGREAIAEGLVDDALKGMDKRAAKWPASILSTETDTYAGPEFLKAVRFIHINASKLLHTASAAKEVAPELDDPEGEQSEEAN
jgi:HK97 family phage portal protein